LHATGKKVLADFDASFTNTISALLPMAPEKLVVSEQLALGKAEAEVRAVVGGEVDLEGLPLNDVLTSLRTHAALALTKVQALNEQQLVRVQKQEQEAYEAAKRTFKESFSSALSSLRATGASIAECEFTRLYDAALSAAKKKLQGGMHAELTSESRTKELRTFLVNACEGIKGEQGAMYQLGSAKALLAKAKEEGDKEVRRVEARGQEERVKLEGKVEEALREAERLRGEVERGGEIWAARVVELENALKRLEKEKEDLKKENKTHELKAAAEARECTRVWEEERKELEKANASLKTELDLLVQEKERLSREKALLQQELVQSSKKRKAAEEGAESAKKARREADTEAAAAQATAAAATAAAAAAAGAAKEEEEEEEDGQGMEVENTAPVEEEEQEAAPQDKKRKTRPLAAKSKGRATAVKGRVPAAKPALSPAAQRKLVEEAREEERKRIEESTARRVTRTRM
jgi:hypothetical protein